MGKECKDCWKFEESEYSQKPGKCGLDDYAVYKNSPACDEFEDRMPEPANGS